LGSIDGSRVYHECHPGAIYLHAGRSYRVRELDTDKRRVLAESVRVDYYTVVLGDKETEILERLDGKRLGEFPIGLGRLKVTVRIREFQKKRLFDGEPIGIHPLTVPPLVFETVGFWIELPAGLPRAFAEKDLHFMGGIHATEHAMIGLFPLLAIADRGDIGGISYTGHPQTEGPAIFVYDGIPGGAGLARQGFDEVRSHLRRTLELVDGCKCEVGCPACIQSPKCGNGNKPLDKQAAVLVMQTLLGDVELSRLGVEPSKRDERTPLRPFVSRRAPESGRRHGVRRGGNTQDASTSVENDAPRVAPNSDTSVQRERHPMPASSSARTLVFDLETQRSAAEVGGWDQSHKMGLALAVVYDVQRESYRTYYETDVDRLLLDLVMAGGTRGRIQCRPIRPGGAQWVHRVGSEPDPHVGHARRDPPASRVQAVASAPVRGEPRRIEERKRTAEPAVVEGRAARPDRELLPQGCGSDAQVVRSGARAEVPALP